MTAPSTSVGIVVLSWNRRERLLACLSRLERLTGAAVTIVVVDNASSDGSVDAIRRDFPDVTLLPQATNLGFVGGVNAGLREARRCGMKYAWLLNDDTLVDEDVLPKLVAFAAEHPHLSVFSPVIRDDDEQRALQFANGIVDWDGSEVFGDLPEARFDALVAGGGTPVLIGTALLVDVGVIDSVEGFDPAFFAYWEDIDFCVRCAKAGFVSAVVPDATVLHDSPPLYTRPPHYFYYMIRNEAVFWSRHAKPGAAGWRRGWLARALVWLGTARDLRRDDVVRACTDAIWDALKRHVGQRDATRAAPGWFARILTSHPHLLVLLLQGKIGLIARRLAGRNDRQRPAG